MPSRWLEMNPCLSSGFTAEIALEVEASGAGNGGIDFEVFARTGALTVNQYRITVSRTAVHYRYDGKLEPLAEGLDNSGRHVYRVAVRPNTAAQIYRDGELLGVRAADLRIDWRAPARGHYLEFGAGVPGVRADVGHVAYDLSGPYAPAVSGPDQVRARDAAYNGIVMGNSRRGSVSLNSFSNGIRRCP